MKEGKQHASIGMTDKWIKDTGLVMALLCVILGLGTYRGFLYAAIALLVLTILLPKALYPVAYLWHKLVVILGLVMPKVFFGLVFFVVVTPIGYIRRLFKKDELLVKGWQSIGTAFYDRGKIYTRGDVETPY